MSGAPVTVPGVGAIVAVEGLDGAGKATLVDAVARAAAARGASVATLAFPRYDDDVHAALAGAALHGDLGDGGGVAASVHGMALLFALDRSAAAPRMRAAAADHDVLLVDRYVASNAAYGAARRGEDAAGPFVAWVHDLEIGRLAVPPPDLHLLVRVAPDEAARRVRGRAAADPDRDPDAYEADAGLQARCAAVYDALAARAWLAPWVVAAPSASDAGATGRPGPDPDELAATARRVLDVCLDGADGSDLSVNSDTIET